MANPWKTLKGFFAPEREQVATITADNGDGSFQVQMYGGGEVRVFGSGFQSGQTVFVKGSQIQSLAPSINIQQIEV